MPSLGMKGSYALTVDAIDREVTTTSPGNYGLGYTSSDGTFIVKYVGRSDSDVNGRLKNWVGSYERFKFSYASSAKAAFEKECHNYHDFGENEELDNKDHPRRPSGSGWRCPACPIFN